MSTEILQCMIKTVYVFKLPPRQSNRAQRAADWNLTKPDWEGCLKIISSGNDLRIDLIDKENGKLFATCPVDGKAGSGCCYEHVADSSRYFIIKIVSNGKHAFIGLGFAERSEAFDFTGSIGDFFQRDKKLEQIKREFANQPKLDMSLREGQKMTINIENLKHKKTSNTSNKPGIQNKPLCIINLPDNFGDAPASNQKTNLPSDQIIIESQHPISSNDSNNILEDLFGDSSVSANSDFNFNFGGNNKPSSDFTNLPGQEISASIINQNDVLNTFDFGSNPLVNAGNNAQNSYNQFGGNNPNQTDQFNQNSQFNNNNQFNINNQFTNSNQFNQNNQFNNNNQFDQSIQFNNNNQFDQSIQFNNNNQFDQSIQLNNNQFNQSTQINSNNQFSQPTSNYNHTNQQNNSNDPFADPFDSMFNEQNQTSEGGGFNIANPFE